MKTLRLLAALATLTLAASTTCAAEINLSNVLGPSGGYITQAYYQSMLGSQPMTAAQQAYANQENHLRLMGFLSELGGDFALGQIFYHIAYGITPPPPALDLASGGSDLGPPSITPSGLVTGASDGGDTGAGLTGASDVVDSGVTLTASVNTSAGLTLIGLAPATAVRGRRSYAAPWTADQGPPVQPNKASSTDERLPDLRAIVAATTLQSLARESLLASLARRRASA